MAPTVLYTICALGALGLYLLLITGTPDQPEGGAGRGSGVGHHAMRAAGALLALVAFGFLVARSADFMGLPAAGGRPGLFYVLFSAIALIAAVKMITHPRPVYSALYFVLVVLSSAGLFLLLEAEFMAFALIIVYAGAILITYMFVLMLAQQAPTAADPTGQPEYDLHPREPAMGAVVGFILLALLSHMVLDGTPTLPAPKTPEQARVAAWEELRALPGRLREFVSREVDGPFSLVTTPGAGGEPRPLLTVADDGSGATVAYAVPGDARTHELALPADAMPENVQRVGLALIASFPVSLELAGVILLMAMLGAVILARRQIELTEDEKREAAGLRRHGLHDEVAGAEGGAG